jgi:hypothetical protein
MDAAHMQRLALLLRDEAVFVQADDRTPGALRYAQTHLPWPHPSSVGVEDGMAVVVLSKETAKPPAAD